MLVIDVVDESEDDNDERQSDVDYLCVLECSDHVNDDSLLVENEI